MGCLMMNDTEECDANIKRYVDTDGFVNSAGVIEVPFEELCVLVDMASRKEKVDIFIKLMVQIVTENEGDKEFFQYIEGRIEKETTRVMEEMASGLTREENK